MTSEFRAEPDTNLAAADPFLTKLRALRASLPTDAREIRYRLEEMECRFLETYAESASTT